MHAWRHESELRSLQPRLDAYWAVDNNRPDGTDAERENYYRQVVAPHEDAFLADFPQGVPERTAWEVILREENWRSVLRSWRHDGQQIFEFAPDLLAMLADTDVNELPVQNLRMPYDTFYVALAPGHFLPDYNRDWVVDGFYITAEMCLVDSLRLRPRPPNELIAEQRKQWRILSESRALWRDCVRVVPKALRVLTVTLRSYWPTMQLLNSFMTDTCKILMR